MIKISQVFKVLKKLHLNVDILNNFLYKGALDNFSLIPQFFFQKSWAFYTIRSVYLCSDCIFNFTCNFNFITQLCEFFLQRPFLKVYF